MTEMAALIISPPDILGHGKMQIECHSVYSLSETVSTIYGRVDWEEYAWIMFYI
jgi:hypothetical protein